MQFKNDIVEAYYFKVQQYANSTLIPVVRNYLVVVDAFFNFIRTSIIEK